MLLMIGVMPYYALPRILHESACRDVGGHTAYTAYVPVKGDGMRRVLPSVLPAAAAAAPLVSTAGPVCLQRERSDWGEVPYEEYCDALIGDGCLPRDRMDESCGMIYTDGLEICIEETWQRNRRSHRCWPLWMRDRSRRSALIVRGTAPTASVRCEAPFGAYATLTITSDGSSR